MRGEQARGGGSCLAEGTASRLMGKDRVFLKKPQELSGLEARGGWEWPGPRVQLFPVPRSATSCL